MLWVNLFPEIALKDFVHWHLFKYQCLRAAFKSAFKGGRLSVAIKSVFKGGRLRVRLRVRLRDSELPNMPFLIAEAKP